MMNCNVKECPWVIYCKWMCKRHYRMMYRRWTTEEFVHTARQSECKVKNCSDKVMFIWYCKFHYNRSKVWKDLNTPSCHTKRPAIIEWDVAKIPLWINAKDWYAIVDKEFAYLDKHNRTPWSTWYACATCNNKRIVMHHIILWKPKKPLVTDHINRNKLDNRKCNLRHCTQSVNNYNKWRKWRWLNAARGMTYIEKNWKMRDVIAIRRQSTVVVWSYKTEYWAMQKRNAVENLYHWIKW